MMYFLKVILLVLLLFIVKPECCKSVSIYLESEEIYEYLSYLEARGYFVSSIFGIKPISLQETKRLIDEISARNNLDRVSLWILKCIEERLNLLSLDRDFIKPVSQISLSYSYSDSDLIKDFYYNNYGDNFSSDNNLRLTFNSVAKFSRFFFFLRPKLKIGDDYSGVCLEEAYFTFNIGNVDFFFGKSSQWWGIGKNGAILISNNAEPFTLFKISNDRPFILPWIFKYLGLFKFSFFVTRLEDDRFVPHPYLWGLRLDFKPYPYIEIGISRTALLGGEGRSKGFSTWIKSFLGKEENEKEDQPGDQKAGFDVKITIPCKTQPFQVYLEAAGEDQAGNLPYKWAYLTGIYLPKVLTLENLSIRFEYAITDKHWYTHGIYRSGYTYKGRIIGHHIGRDAEDYWGEIRYFVPEEDMVINFGVEKIFYKRYSPQQDELNFYFSIMKKLKKHSWLTILFRHYEIDDYKGSYDSRDINFLLVQFDQNF